VLLCRYNIINFDLPYLLDRAATLKVDTFPYLGRIKNSACKQKNKTFESKAYGKRENKEMNIEGRVQFDLLPVFLREYKVLVPHPCLSADRAVD
jgi:DNA polymerase delta subunit 1